MSRQTHTLTISLGGRRLRVEAVSQRGSAGYTRLHSINTIWLEVNVTEDLGGRPGETRLELTDVTQLIGSLGDDAWAKVRERVGLATAEAAFEEEDLRHG